MVSFLRKWDKAVEWNVARMPEVTRDAGCSAPSLVNGLLLMQEQREQQHLVTLAVKGN